MAQKAAELIKKAMALNDAGRLDEASRIVGEALAIDENSFEALLLDGIIRVRAGSFDAARTSLEAACKEDPDSFLAHHWISVVYAKLGLKAEATSHALRAVALDPNEIAYERLGLCYLETQNNSEAETCFRTALSIQPASASLLGGLGLALRGLGRAAEARETFRRATETDPASATSHIRLAISLLEDQNAEAAIKSARRALKLKPKSIDALTVLVSALLLENRASEAEDHLKETTRGMPASARTFTLLGQIKQVLGQTQAARELFEEALKIEPLNGEACLGFARSHRATERDLPIIDRLESALKTGELPIDAQKNLNFALGKAQEDLGRNEESMKHYDEANRITYANRYGNSPFNRNLYSANTDSRIQIFSTQFMIRNRNEGSPTELPVIVLGMMRSGTTLAEQILFSHPEVGAAGEQAFWTKNEMKAFEPRRPELIPGKLRLLVEEYCTLLRAVAPGKKLVVDKMPGNYAVLPLIHLAMPNARIIHMRRHPVDTCISIYATPNATRIDWSHDRENIVFAYEEYRRMMAAWRKVVPSDRMMEIDYEDLVSNQEQITRKMIDFCGLEWDDACLYPEQSERSVTTPSSWQVRQAIYRTSIERWRRFEPWLGPFARLLPEKLD